MIQSCTVIAICIAQFQATVKESHVDKIKSEQLIELRTIIDKESQKRSDFLLPVNPRKRWIEVFNKTRWRNSVPEAVRILITSPIANERIVGWNLARDYGFKIGWSQSDIESTLNEKSDEVKSSALRSISVSDPRWLKTCIEQNLNNSTTSTDIRQLCTHLIPKVPSLPDRVDLWHNAASQVELRSACIHSFPSVHSSPTTVRVVVNFLDDTSVDRVAISADFQIPMQIRTLACQQLERVVVHNTGEMQTEVVEEIWEQANIPPESEQLEFFVTAIVAIHTLDPDFVGLQNLLMKWYIALPSKKAKILKMLQESSLAFPEFEQYVVDHVQSMKPIEKVCVCEWLAKQKTASTRAALEDLLKDQHPGVCLSATVAITQTNPLFNITKERELLLGCSVSSPSKLSINYSSVEDAMRALALAGHSDIEAIHWLKKKRTPELDEICSKTLDNLLFMVKEDEF